MARPSFRARAGESVRRVLPGNTDRAPIGLHEPAGDPEESRLSRSVLADEGMYLAGAAIEADVGQRPDRPELAGDARQFEDQSSRSSTLLPGPPMLILPDTSAREPRPGPTRCWTRSG